VCTTGTMVGMLGVYHGYHGGHVPQGVREAYTSVCERGIYPPWCKECTPTMVQGVYTHHVREEATYPPCTGGGYLPTMVHPGIPTTMVHPGIPTTPGTPPAPLACWSLLYMAGGCTQRDVREPWAQLRE